MIVYEEAKNSEVKEISKMSTESFGYYPFFDFVFKDAFKNYDDYFKYMDKLHYVHIKANMRKYKCFVGKENGKILSSIIIQKPKAQNVTLFDYIVSGGIKLIFPIGIFKILKFFKISEDANKECMNKYPNSWYIEMLVVNPKQKGKGLGSKMLNDFAFNYVKNENGNEICLITNTENNSRFYKKNGFYEIEKKQLEYGDKKIDNWSFTIKI